jgi:hypothetical protein
MANTSPDQRPPLGRYICRVCDKAHRPGCIRDIDPTVPCEQDEAVASPAHRHHFVGFALWAYCRDCTTETRMENGPNGAREYRSWPGAEWTNDVPACPPKEMMCAPSLKGALAKMVARAARKVRTDQKR